MWLGEGRFLGDQGIVEHCHYYRIGKKNVNDNATQRNATRRNATQRNTTQRNKIET